MELDIATFSPTRAELTKLAEEAKALNLPDPFDQEQLTKVGEVRRRLMKARTTITKAGLELRDEANKFRTAVLAKEKEYLAIVTPEENRLIALEDGAEKAIERKARIELLPHRKERLAAIGDTVEVSDDELLDMDGPAFEGYCNLRVAGKNEADSSRIAAEKWALDDERKTLEREKEMRDREEKARQNERERLAREQKEREARQEREKQEAEERAQKEKERLEREVRYQAFLNDHGYTEGTKQTFHIERDGEDVRLYRLVGILNIK